MKSPLKNLEYQKEIYSPFLFAVRIKDLTDSWYEVDKA